MFRERERVREREKERERDREIDGGQMSKADCASYLTYVLQYLLQTAQTKHRRSQRQY